MQICTAFFVIVTIVAIETIETIVTIETIEAIATIEAISIKKAAATRQSCSRILSYCRFQIWLLRKWDCLVRANRSASTALCAQIGVNRILLAFRDCAYRALINTCTASDAVVTNYVCHSFKSLMLLLMFYFLSLVKYLKVWCKDKIFFREYLKQGMFFSWKRKKLLPSWTERLSQHEYDSNDHTTRNCRMLCGQ